MLRSWGILFFYPYLSLVDMLFVLFKKFVLFVLFFLSSHSKKMYALFSVLPNFPFTFLFMSRKKATSSKKRCRPMKG